MTLEPFAVEHFEILGLHEKLQTAALNVVAGPAFSLVEDGKILACGGVRCQGIGEAWAVLDPTAARERTKTILRAAREVIDRAKDEAHLYRLYAEATVDQPAWFRHLGFLQSDKLYVR